MSKSLKFSIAILVIVVLTFVSLAILFITKNTSFLILNIPDSTLNINNQNANSTDDFSVLIAQTLNVPNVYKNGKFLENKTLNLPKNFKVSLWTAGLNKPRHITFTPENNIIVADMGSNSIKLIKPSSDNTFGEKIIAIDSNLSAPSSVDYYNGDLYVAEQDKITVYKNFLEDGTYSKKMVLISDLPSDGSHITRTAKVGPDEKLYITIGSSCNICEESDSRRAAMLTANLDGTNLQVYAEGLRNTVDFIFKSTANNFEIWGVDNGRDLIGDNIPPDEVNIINKNKNYGWPYCYGDGINNPEYQNMAGFCSTQTQNPIYNLTAHSAPLGLTFLNNSDLTQIIKFPENIFRNNLFISFHGSWNKSTPTGYKIVRIDTSKSNSSEVNFITGWLQSNGNAWGRPVDVKFDKNGDLFITDDTANAIYKVEYLKSE